MTVAGASRCRTSKAMSPSHRSAIGRKRLNPALIFAALGDETRLALVVKLAGGKPRSISQLTKGSKLTRQAISKHLRVLEAVGVVRSIRQGRESLFEFNPRPIDRLKRHLESVSEQWDESLSRLRRFVES